MTISCGNLFDKKKLNLKIIENEEIKIEVYDISNITSIHQFADITNKRWNKSERIFEGNSNTIEKIKIKNDTIYIMTKQLEPIIYDLAAIKFSYKVVIETNKLK
jgi:hypothetical protein